MSTYMWPPLLCSVDCVFYANVKRDFPTGASRNAFAGKLNSDKATGVSNKLAVFRSLSGLM